ncbi:MAG: ABC transporter permease [Candidatus Aenigmatarchaeota archaeon]|nr:ABC transporter permease [Candidatus Aenigmarchaeota archaeon]
MSELEGVYWIWLRDLKRFWRSTSRLIGSFAMPILFLVIFGAGFNFVRIGSVNYTTFLFPGIVAMSLLFTSLNSGISVIWDREFGFMKEILVSPILRISIFIGKSLGGVSTAIIQGVIILLLSFFIGIHISLTSFLIALPIMVLISLGMVGLGLIIASFVETFEGFGLIMNFINFPLFFTSGAIFPLDQAPTWLKAISYVNPVTYGVDALRQVLIGISSLSFFTDILVVIVFTFATILIGNLAFNRQK